MNNKFLKEFICSTDKFREEKTYWINKLESNYKRNHFPYDFSESEDNIYKKNTYNFKLCDELASKLIKVSNNSNKNIYIFLLTNIVTILHKYTGDNELFEENVCQYPNKTAVKCGNEKLTYDELNKRTNKLARLLREKGVNRDKLVCILCERSIDMLVAILATFKAGGAYIPLDVKYPIDRIKTIISDSGSEVLLTSSYIHSNIEDLYMEIGLNTNVNCIISMNELKEINKYDKLFRNIPRW